MIRYDRSGYDRIVSIGSWNIENLNIDCENIEILSLRDLFPKDLFHFLIFKKCINVFIEKWRFYKTFSMEQMIIFENFPYR